MRHILHKTTFETCADSYLIVFTIFERDNFNCKRHRTTILTRVNLSLKYKEFTRPMTPLNFPHLRFTFASNRKRFLRYKTEILGYLDTIHHVSN